MTEVARQEGFLALLEQHKKILWKVAGAYCPGAADREDLVQEMVVQLWRSFDRYDERFKFSTWMYRVALNVAISHRRSESRRPRHTVPLAGAVLEIATAGGEVENDLRRLWESIGQLSELDRALVLLYLDGHRHDAIGEILGLSETNVGTKLGRIKEKLRRRLGPGANAEDSR